MSGLARRGLGRLYYRSGRRLECPLCGGRFRAFRSYGVVERRDAVCPACGSFERHRLLWLYLRDRTDLGQAPARLLHFAPEPCLEGALRKLPGVEYVNADLERPDVDLNLDITAMPFPEASFDAAICAHVLEHVPDDRAAMRELVRVLRPRGWAIVMAPVNQAAATDEDPDVTDPAERERRFAQRDHVRMYGADLEDRLAEAGFTVGVADYAAELGSEVAGRLSLCETPADGSPTFPSLIYRCTRPAG